MQLEKLKNKKKAMEYFIKKKKDIEVLRLLIIVLVIIFSVIFGVREFMHFKQIKELTNKIWAYNPETGSVSSLDKIPFTINERKSEYEHHVVDYLNHWYSFDQYTFLDRIDYARNLIDKESFDKEITKYQEENTLGVLEERDIIVTIEPPKVVIDISKRPFSGTFSIVQTLRTKENMRQRIIEGTFNIKDTQGRSSENSHAAQIYNYTITRKEILKK